MSITFRTIPDPGRRGSRYATGGDWRKANPRKATSLGKVWVWVAGSILDVTSSNCDLPRLQQTWFWAANMVCVVPYICQKLEWIVEVAWQHGKGSILRKACCLLLTIPHLLPRQVLSVWRGSWLALPPSSCRKCHSLRNSLWSHENVYTATTPKKIRL